jgi:hypothetical protein
LAAEVVLHDETQETRFVWFNTEAGWMFRFMMPPRPFLDR